MHEMTLTDLRTFKKINGIDSSPNRSSNVFIVSRLTHHLIMNFLSIMYTKKESNSNFSVSEFFAFVETNTPIYQAPNLFYDESRNTYYVNDDNLFVNLIYDSSKYYLHYNKRQTSNGRYYIDEYVYFLTWIADGIPKVNECFEKLFSAALRNSSWNKGLIEFKDIQMEEEIPDKLKLFLRPNDDLSELYIPEIKIKHAKRFIYAIKNYDKDGINLRYLLNGPPGTGKTKFIRSIIKEIDSYCTVILVQGEDIKFSQLFDFASNFSPCVIVLDDLDLLLKSREDFTGTKQLGPFLQFLDGFLPSSIFILATTNDKTLVDKAASRPGRFDLVIDLSEIKPESIKSLVARETNDSEIISLFTKEVYEELKEKKVTGAFVVSLVKQLVSLKKVTKKITAIDIKESIEITYQGYYKSNADKSNDSVGFIS